MDFRQYVRERMPTLATSGDSDMVEELAQHLEDLYREAHASGLDHEAALARAASALPMHGEGLSRELEVSSRGWSGVAADRCAAWWDPFHDSSRGSSMLSDLRLDLKYALRTLVRTPGFTLMATVVLAIGIGANAAVFSLANAFFLRPLPVAHPDSVVRVYSNRWSNTVHRSYLEFRDRNSTLAGLAAFQMQSFGLRIDADTEHVFGSIVSGNYFPVLGVAAARGRLLGVPDDRPDASPAVVLSHAFWTRRFGASRDIVGRTIAINDQPFTVVGVAAEGFTGLMAPLVGDLWVPLAADALLRPALDPATRLDRTSLHLVGRLKPGIDRARVQADLDTIGRQLRRARGEPDQGQAVTVYGSTTLHPEISAPVTAFTAVLMTLVAVVLLIVCVNVANLVLARAAGRDTELVIRQSLGATRGRLVRQLITESLLLSLAGAVLGVAIALACTRLVTALPLPAPFPIALDLTVDFRVLAFTLLSAVAATLACGVVPALSASRIDLVRATRGTGVEGPRHGRLRSAFLIAQVSMSVLLLISAGLFIRGYRQAQSLDTGFDAEQILTAALDLDTRGYSPERGREFVRLLTTRLESVPGVTSVNLVDIVPVTLSNTAMFLLRDGDVDPAPGQRPPTPLVNFNGVEPGHFRTLRIGLVAGRDFTDHDGEGAARVAIVNETLARRFWPDRSAVGQRVRIVGESSGDGPGIEIVGVVRDSTYVTVGEAPRPFMYRPLAQAYTPRVTMLVRSADTTASVLSAIRREVRALDPGLAVFGVATMTDAISVSLLPARVAGSLLGALGMVALVLAALGIYGVLSFLVRARTREIGVRVALGATPGALTRLVVRQAMAWTVAGALIGVALAFGLTRFLAGFLYGISPTDAWTFGVVTLLLVMVACIAAVVPAVRATRLDPLVALRTL
jgi:predicted permease